VPDRFIAGADLREMELPIEEPSLPDVVEAIAALQQPVVAAIAGPALGGGLEIALACDLRLAVSRASAGLPETKLGLLPGAGGTQRLPRLVGIARVIEMIGAGRIINMAEAKDLGIFDGIVEDDVVAVAVAAAPTAAKRRLATLPPPSAEGEAERAAAATAVKRRKARVRCPRQSRSCVRQPSSPSRQGCNGSARLSCGRGKARKPKPYAICSWPSERRQRSPACRASSRAPSVGLCIGVQF
jgi:enoyl-CoA hydratase/carnithine racemase